MDCREHNPGVRKSMRIRYVASHRDPVRRRGRLRLSCSVRMSRPRTARPLALRECAARVGHAQRGGCGGRRAARHDPSRRGPDRGQSAAPWSRLVAHGSAAESGPVAKPPSWASSERKDRPATDSLRQSKQTRFWGTHWYLVIPTDLAGSGSNSSRATAAPDLVARVSNL